MCVSECVGVCVQKQLAALELHLLRATADVNTHSKFRNMVKKYYYIKCYIFAPFISIRLGMEFTKRNKFIIIINLNSLL